MYDLQAAHADYTDELHEIECAPAQADAPAQPVFRNSDEARAEFSEFYTADAKPVHIHSCAVCTVPFECVNDSCAPTSPLYQEGDLSRYRCDECRQGQHTNTTPNPKPALPPVAAKVLSKTIYAPDTFVPVTLHGDSWPGSRIQY